MTLISMSGALMAARARDNKSRGAIRSAQPVSVSHAEPRQAEHTPVAAGVLADALKSRNNIRHMAAPTNLQFGSRYPNAKSPLYIAPGFEEEYDKAVASPGMTAVIEEIDGRPTMMDLDTKFFNQGIIMVEGPVTDHMASRMRKQMNYLVSKQKEEDEVKPIFMIIDSPGGSMFAMLAIADSIQMARNTKINGKNIPVIAMINGMAASAGSVIACSATACYMTDNSFFMLHAPISGRHGEWAALQDDRELTERLLKRALKIYSQKTGYTETELANWTYRGARWLDAEQSEKIGLSQGIIKSFEDLLGIDFSEEPKPKSKRPRLHDVAPAPIDGPLDADDDHPDGGRSSGGRRSRKAKE